MEGIDVDLDGVVVPEVGIPPHHLCHQRFGIMGLERDVQVFVVVLHQHHRLQLRGVATIRLELDEVLTTRGGLPFAGFDLPVDLGGTRRALRIEDKVDASARGRLAERRLNDGDATQQCRPHPSARRDGPGEGLR